MARLYPLPGACATSRPRRGKKGRLHRSFTTWAEGLGVMAAGITHYLLFFFLR